MEIITDVIKRGVEFDIKSHYDTGLVAAIKSIPGARWSKEDKVWTLPLYASEILLTDAKQYIPNPIITQKLIDVTSLIQYPLPINLKTPLWPFQITGYRFLLTREKCILADEWGLGKKSQAIAACLYLMQTGARLGRIDKTVIVCIKSDVHQWKDVTGQEGILKFIDIDPDFILVSDGSKSDRMDIYESFIKNSHLQFLILNYEKAIMDDFDIICDNLPKASCLILDECAYVKNFNAKRSKSLLRLKSNYKFALSASPIQNSPIDIYNINRFLDNNSLGSYWDFLNRYAIVSPITIKGKERRIITGWKDIFGIQARMGPLILKRYSKDVLSELPPVSRKTINIALGEKESKVYNFIEDNIRDQIRRNPDDITTILPLLTILKMYCDSPRLLMTSNANILSGFDRSHFDIDGEKFLEFQRLMDMLITDDRQIIIFVSYIEMAKMLLKYVNEKYKDIAIGYYGNISIDNVQQFQQGRYKILISTDKGSHALNLPMASILIHYDMNWNPEVMKQREGRISRPGQESNMLMVKMIVEDEDKIESYIVSKLQMKMKYAETIIDGRL